MIYPATGLSDAHLLFPVIWFPATTQLPIATVTYWTLLSPIINFEHSALSTSLSFLLLAHSRNPSSQFFSPEVPNIYWLYPLIHLDFMDHDRL